MGTNLAIQYTIVAAIIMAALIWVIVKLVKRSKSDDLDSACCGCQLKSSCKKRNSKADKNQCKQ